MNKTIEKYMKELGKITPITEKERERALLALHGNNKKASLEARELLICTHARLVVKIAYSFEGLGLPMLDLIAEGNISLIRGVDVFDPNKRSKFISVIACWIKQGIARAVANNSKTIRIPIHAVRKINKIRAVYMKLTKKLNREPTSLEIAKHLDIPRRTVELLYLSNTQEVSLNEPICEDNNSELKDIIPNKNAIAPDKILADSDSKERLLESIEKLDERERLILKNRFGFCKNSKLTFKELGKQINRTGERVRQIQEEALKKLKVMLIDEIEFINDIE